MVQWLTTKAQRRDRSSRLNTLLAELEFLERASALQEKDRAGDEPGQLQGTLRVENAIRDLLDRYNELPKTVPSVTAPSTGGAEQPSVEELSFFKRMLLLYTPDTKLGWVWHSLFYVFLLATLAFVVPDLLRLQFSGLFGGFVLYFAPMLLFQRLARREVTGRKAFIPPVAVTIGWILLAVFMIL